MTLILAVDAAWTDTEPSGVALLAANGSRWAHRRTDESAPQRSRARRALADDHASSAAAASTSECFENRQRAPRRSRQCVDQNAQRGSDRSSARSRSY